MKTTILFVLVSILCVSALADHHSGAIQLFNGETLDGWVIENDGQFSVKEGKIYVNRGTGWLRSEKAYGDFKLRIEFRFLEDNANSGIFVRTGATSHDDEKGYPNNGYQVQCWDTLEGEHPIATMIPYGAPPFEHSYDLEALKGAYRPAGEWQSYTIVCLHESLKVYLNDVPVAVATSVKNLEGHIGIQGELGLLEFRKFELTEL